MLNITRLHGYFSAVKHYKAHFGKKLKEARKRKGLTQVELAEQIGVKGLAVSIWETGKGFPEKETLPKILKALDLKESYFFDFDIPAHIIAMSPQDLIKYVNQLTEKIENLNEKVKKLEESKKISK